MPDIRRTGRSGATRRVDADGVVEERTGSLSRVELASAAVLVLVGGVIGWFTLRAGDDPHPAPRPPPAVTSPAPGGPRPAAWAPASAPARPRPSSGPRGDAPPSPVTPPGAAPARSPAPGIAARPGGVAPEPAPPAGGALAPEPAPPSPEATGLAAFPPLGTKPILTGVVVPEGYELPPGYVRHFQSTDDGRMLAPVLLYHPDHAPLDAEGRPLAAAKDRVVPRDQVPPGMPVEVLDPDAPEPRP